MHFSAINALLLNKRCAVRRSPSKIGRSMQNHGIVLRNVPLSPPLPNPDFFDHLKSRSKGYASMEYSLIDYRQNDLVKLDVAVNGEPVDALSFILHRDNAYSVGKDLTSKLKEIIPRQMFKVPIQAKVGEKIIASSQISAMRKDVLAKCYGGDVSRKKKLLQKQVRI